MGLQQKHVIAVKVRAHTAAIGGETIGETVEGRRRFPINVRYPQDSRGDLTAVSQALIPLPGSRGISIGTNSTMARRKVRLARQRSASG